MPSFSFPVPLALYKSSLFQAASRSKQDALALFVSTILMKSDGRTGPRWTPVSVRKFSQLVPHNTVRQIRDALIGTHIIECDSRFSYRHPDSRWPMSYRIHPSVNSKTVNYRLKTVTASNRVESFWTPLKTPAINKRGNFQPVHHKLALMVGQFKICRERLKPLISSLNPIETLQVYYQSCKFNGGNFSFSVASVGRFYSPITCMRSVVRKALYCVKEGKGQPLVVLDFRCFQPALLAKQLEGHICSREFARYTSLTRTGQLYDTIAHAIGLTRAEVKAAMLGYLFGPNVPIAPSKPSDVRYLATLQKDEPQRLLVDCWFRAKFPAIATYLRSKKSGPIRYLAKGTPRTRHSRKFQRPYAVIANQLQKAESQLVIEVLSKQLIQQHPEIVFATIHDAILVPQIHESKVKNLVNRTIHSQQIPTIIESEVMKQCL